MLVVDHNDRTVFRDAFRGTELVPTVSRQKAILSMDIGPRDVACVVVLRR